MKKKIAILPVDGRPVTRKLPTELARLVGWEVEVPEIKDLGFLKRPADTDFIQKWLEDAAQVADGVVLSIDMLLYGGLVPSRMHPYTLEELTQKLSILKKLKQVHPSLSIMVMSSVMRISNNNINEEEKEYWQDYGEKVWSLSYHDHRFEKLGDQEDENVVKELRNQIPEDVIADYKETRAINYSINTQLLTYVKEGWIDHLVFPQDDTSLYGWNVKEQEQLRQMIVEDQMEHSVYLYPGADEVASTLLTRMIFQLEGEELPVFYPVYSGMKGALTPAMYEDRPIMESVKGQIYAIGSRTEDELAFADLVLGVNVPGQKQGDLALGLHLNQVDTNDRNLFEWIARLQAFMKRKPVAIADVAYANGADPALFTALLKAVNWEDLYGYAAWNTAGNTLGTVVSHAALSWLGEKKGLDNENVRARLMVERFLDDYVYQTLVRKEARKQLESLLELNDVVLPLFDGEAKRFLHNWAQGWEISNVYLPWNRTFEIGFNVSRREETQ